MDASDKPIPSALVWKGSRGTPQCRQPVVWQLLLVHGTCQVTCTFSTPILHAGHPFFLVAMHTVASISQSNIPPAN
jgi:hypothetical protein